MNIFKFFLFPFALIYGAIVQLKNWMYDNDVLLHTTSFEIPIICVGNISVGGTGKTPMVEYLIRKIDPLFELAVLSRGYRRSSSGFKMASIKTDFTEIGDEPRQLKLKYRHIPIAVGEQRVFAIPELLQSAPKTKVILMDDGFQHRSLKAFINIVLTNYNEPFWDDYLLPMGLLREPRSGLRRADILIVTKCPTTITKEEETEIIAKINPGKHQKVFLATERYWTPYNLFDANDKLPLDKKVNVVLFAGLGNSDSLKKYVEESCKEVVWMSFDDHHRYSERDLEHIFQVKQNFGLESILLTTEKDAVRLEPYFNWFKKNNLAVYCLPVETKFLSDTGTTFDQLIYDSLNYFYND